MTWLSELSLRNFWFELKAQLQVLIGMEGAEAHVHIGLLLFVIAVIALRRRRGGIVLAWVFVLLVQLANEMLDARDWIGWTGRANWPEMITDTVATLFWPTVMGAMLAWFRRTGPLDVAPRSKMGPFEREDRI